MSTIRVGAGIATIEIDRALSDNIARAIDSVAPTLRSELLKEAKSLEEDALSRWPVGTDKDRSKDRFSVGVRIVSPTRIESYIRNGASYAYFIKSKKNRRKL